MSLFPSFESNRAQPESALSEQIHLQPGGRSPQTLVQDAATGKRGAAWRLLQRVLENDPPAIEAIASCTDQRLIEHFVEFLALGTWAGKPFVKPAPLHTPYTLTRLRTLFVPPSGIDPALSEPVVLALAADERSAAREAALFLLGLMGLQDALPTLVLALHDQVPSVRFQAAKALGYTGNPDAVQGLLTVLPDADEHMGDQIFVALLTLGHVAVPALLALTQSLCLDALAEYSCPEQDHDPRGLPVLVNALHDADHGVAWMAAKGLVPFGPDSIEPMLHLLTTAQMTPWIVETASYVLHSQCHIHETFKPYLEPLVQQMHQSAYRSSTGYLARNTLEHLRADRLLP